MRIFKKKKIVRIIALLIAVVICFNGCAVSVNEEELEEVVEEAENEVKNRISQKVEGFFIEKSNQISEKWNDLLGRDMSITFYPREGIDGPTEQRFKNGSNPKITDEKPSREGYHFVGWTRIPESNEPEFFAGKKTLYPFTQDTILYACWEEYNPENPFTIEKDNGKTLNVFGGEKNFVVEHKYHLIEENKGKVVRIQCTCGFEITDRKMTQDMFVNLVTNGKNKTFDSLKEAKQKEYKKQHILYCTQDFAPAAIILIGSFYDTCDAVSSTIDDSTSAFDTFFDTVEKAANFNLAYAKSKYTPEYVSLKYNQRHHMPNGETIDYALNKMRTEDQYKPYRDFSNEFFGKISKASKYGSVAIGIARAAYYSYDALSEGANGSIDKMPEFVKAINAVVSFMPYGGSYYEALFDTLEEGLELYVQCVKERDRYYAILDVILEQKTVIAGTDLKITEIEQARLGNFTDPSTNEEVLPTTIEVVGSLISISDGEEAIEEFSVLSENDKILVAWYLTMRLEYDFQKQFGITLEEYLQYIG